MTKNQFKKRIEAMDRTKLETWLLNLFDSSTAFRDSVSVSLNPSEGRKLLLTYQKKLEKAFNLRNFNLSTVKSIVAEFEGTVADERLRAEMNIVYATLAADLSRAYGDFGKSFYNSIYDAGVKGIRYLEEYPEEFDDVLPLIEDMINSCGFFGYGVQDDLRMEYNRLFEMLCDAGYIEEG